MMINRRFKTDINRPGETICGWSDLPMTGCAHCHGNAHPRPADRTDTPDHAQAPATHQPGDSAGAHDSTPDPDCHACQGKNKEETA